MDKGLEYESMMDFLDKYQKRMMEFRNQTLTLRNIEEYDKWVSQAQNCADQMQEIYLTNARELKTELLPWLQPDHERSAEDYRVLKAAAQSQYDASTGDMFLLWEILDVIFPYYEEYGTLEERIEVNTYAAFVYLEIARIFPETYGESCIRCYEYVLDQEYRAEEFEEPIAMRWVAVAYANLLIVAPDIPIITVEKSYEYYCRLERLMNSPVYQVYQQNEQRAVELMNMFAQRFREEGYQLYLDNPKGTDAKLVKTLIGFQKKLLANGSEEELSPEVFVTELRIQKEQGKMSADEAWKRLDDFMETRRLTLDSEKDDIVDFYMICMINLMQLLDITSLPQKERKRYAAHYMEILEQFIRDYEYHSRTTYTIGNVLAVIASEPLFYSYMETTDDKIRFLYRFVLTRHLATCLHSHMVAKLAEVILKHMITRRKELLVGVHGIRSVEEVEAKKQQLKDFVHNAALLHDIGKSTILDIIDTQYRPIFDREFEMIRQHPDKGADMLKKDDALQDYEEIARGHHIFYDGSGGYPRDCVIHPQNRRLVSLIALCDCLDAATDTLGRNYRRAKSVPQVIEEFHQGAGTRYDPELVDLLVSDRELQEEISVIVTRRRKEIAQKLMRGEEDVF